VKKEQAIIFSVIGAAIFMGLLLLVSYYGWNNGNLRSSPAIDTETNIVKNNTGDYSDKFRILPDPDPPLISASGLKVEKVIEGLALPTSMAFLDHNKVVVLEKDNGKVRLVLDGVLQSDSIFETVVVNNNERGLLGVAIANGTSDMKTVFLYFTEQVGDEVRNRIYRYSWDGDSKFSGETLVVDLPGQPGPNHDGGKVTVGPDGMLYAVIGDLNRNGMLQNYRSGAEPDDTSVVLRVDHDGNAANSILPSSLSKYYAYGIRNSFGIDFDPVSQSMWMTENGPDSYDEINLVNPGFNSGWEQVMGPIDRVQRTVDNLMQFDGSYYADPLFSWREAQGITDIEFLNSTKLGEKYTHNIFVGDINNGNLYFFEVNGRRNGLELDNKMLQDLVADNNEELGTVTFGSGFGGITDIETGPDGYLYILTFDGNLYRIVPAN
jgi:aldose sugar dehydrogenase